MSLPHRLQATLDLLKHYREVFKQVWKIRKELEPESRLPYEAEFLPAALSLQATPVSPAPRVAMLLIISFASLAILWAIFGQMDIVATAHGKIVPNDRVKTIQPLEAAIVKAIYVSDGQMVKAGQLLLEMDATTISADKERTVNDLTIARLQVARAKALLDALDNKHPPALERITDIDDRQFSDAQRLVLGQYEEVKTKLQRIDAEIERHQAEQRSALTLINTLKRTVPIAQEREQDYKSLMDGSFVSKHGYLEREQTRIEQEGGLANQISKLKEIQASLLEAQRQHAELIAEVRRTNLDSLNEGEQKTNTLEQELIKANTHYQLTKVRAPVNGTVQQLAVHTVGGVVTPAQALMVIVPRDNPLEVEAFIANKDIGFVHGGQTAEVKIETFQYTKYGTIHARVASVSHDAINDEKLGLIYSSRIRMARSNIQVDGTLVNLSPGMAVTVEIKTGKRHIIEFFLSPFLQYTKESLRER